MVRPLIVSIPARLGHLERPPEAGSRTWDTRGRYRPTRKESSVRCDGIASSSVSHLQVRHRQAPGMNERDPRSNHQLP